LKKEVQNVVDAGGKVFVELGSGSGLSTNVIASALPPRAKLYAIDNWTTTQEYENFLSKNLIKKLAHKIISIRKSTDEAAKVFNKTIDFLFVNAGRDYEAVYKDIMNWYPKLSKNGVICGNDFNLLFIEKAAVNATADLNASVFLVPNTKDFWKMARDVSYQSSLPEPYKSAELLPYDNQGSLPYPNELREEVQNVVNNGGKVFVELGAWFGKSSRLIADMLPLGAELYSVDAWKGDPMVSYYKNHRKFHMVFNYFLSNNIIKRLAHKIHPIRMFTNEAAKVFNKTIDFLFIDAGHDYKAVYNDIMNWFPKVSKNGVICGDDLFLPDLENAAVDAAADLNASVFLVKNTNRFWKMAKNVSYQVSLPEPYKSAELLPFEDSGALCYRNELKAEVKRVVRNGGQVFVELGSWMGSTTRLIAPLIPLGKKVYAVDTWKDAQYNTQTPYQKQKLFEYFLSNNVIKRKAHKIHPVRMSRNEAVKVFTKAIDFLFVNAGHDYHAVYNDIMNWYPKLSKKGVICGNDWTKEYVSSAVNNAAADLHTSVFLVPNTTRFWKMNIN
jgi:predicted O-methyltransferase YrrM